MRKQKRKSGFELCEALIEQLSKRAYRKPGGPDARKLIHAGCLILQGVAPLVFSDEVGFNDPNVVPKAIGHINAVLAAAQEWVKNGDTEDLVILSGQPSEEFNELLATLSEEGEANVGTMAGLLIEGALSLDPEWLAVNAEGDERDTAERGAIGIWELIAEHAHDALSCTEQQIDWDNMYTVLQRETERIGTQST